MSSNRVVLEQAAQEMADATATPPFIYQLPPDEGRQVLEDLQAGEGVPKPEIDEDWVTVRGGPTEQVPVRIVRPAGASGTLPVVLYIHGAGWVFGSAATHDRLVREIAVRTGCAVVFPDYDRSPEARYPIAVQQCYAVAEWVVAEGAGQGLDASRMAVCGDSVGGNMAIAMTLLAKETGTIGLAGQVLFYPVTDASFDTESYHRFADGYYLTREAMIWFWDQYTTDPNDRAQITCSPLGARTDQLTGLPPAMVITGEADVLRDEGEAYAARLREAGVPVSAIRCQGIIHDFMMLDAMRDTSACTAAMEMSTLFLRRVLDTGGAAIPRQAGSRATAPTR
ncbi:alpha/beta hydrolase [Nocardiopsis mangrovi]|uniref:Alpha/beta hydrolase n=1 Tax=Nocardiopsis mangrovi TaxID=1179818 RepID=A0ABV9DZ45_9ACTN